MSANEIPDQIAIDGVRRPTRLCEGRLIHPTPEGIEAFWAWFGDSRVVDTEGRPLVVYHGTSRERSVAYADDGFIGNFDFDGPKFFSSSPDQAVNYTHGDGAALVPAHLSIRNPYLITEADGGFEYLDGSEGGGIYEDAEYLAEQGYDGAVWRDSGKPDVWVVFCPEQIKSAFNLGTFDPANPDIRHTEQEVVIQPAKRRAPGMGM